MVKGLPTDCQIVFRWAPGCKFVTVFGTELQKFGQVTVAVLEDKSTNLKFPFQQPPCMSEPRSIKKPVRTFGAATDISQSLGLYMEFR